MKQKRSCSPNILQIQEDITKNTLDAIIRKHGKNEAAIMLSAVQIMISGNMYGIPYSAFHSRLKGKSYKDSSLFFELGMLVTGILFLPIANIHGILRALIGLPNKRLEKNKIYEG